MLSFTYSEAFVEYWSKDPKTAQERGTRWDLQTFSDIFLGFGNQKIFRNPCMSDTSYYEFLSFCILTTVLNNYIKLHGYEWVIFCFTSLKSDETHSYRCKNCWTTLYETIIYRNRPLHGFRRHLGCGAVAAKISANVWEILQLSTLITPQLQVQFWWKMCL